MASRKKVGVEDHSPGDAEGRAKPLRAQRSRARAAPSNRMLDAAAGPMTLEEVLVGFQRSLARATRASLEAARADWEVGFGQRSLYVIDGVGVRLQAGIQAATDPSGVVQAVMLDLGQSSNPEASTIEFRVQARPIEAIAEEQLVLADLDALGLKRPRHPMRLTLIGRSAGSGQVKSPSQDNPPRSPAGSKGALPAAGDNRPVDLIREQPPLIPLAHTEVTLHVMGMDADVVERFVLTTNPFGQIDVDIDASTNRIVSGHREEHLSRLDLAGHEDAFFVFATCDASRSPGLSRALTSNVLEFSVRRAPSPSSRNAPPRKVKP